MQKDGESPEFALRGAFKFQACWMFESSTFIPGTSTFVLLFVLFCFGKASPLSNDYAGKTFDWSEIKVYYI